VTSVEIHATRYAVEDSTERLTLDTGVCTTKGDRLPFAVLEYKSVAGGQALPQTIVALDLIQLKFSKLLWGTR
jgi:hypothetical protein